jgi:hypothetical protein
MDADAVIDTCSDFSMIPNYMAKLLELSQSASLKSIRLATGNLHVVPTCYAEVRIANLFITEHMLVLDHLQDPILGLSLLQQFLVVLDSSKKQVLLKPYRNKWHHNE